MPDCLYLCACREAFAQNYSGRAVYQEAHYREHILAYDLSGEGERVRAHSFSCASRLAILTACCSCM